MDYGDYRDYVDLSETLREWEYNPNEISVRKILIPGGRVAIQMRVEMGIIQMESTGRPDRKRPYGCESLLEYYQKEIDKLSGSPQVLAIPPEQCASLKVEAGLYYRRHVANYVLEDHSNVCVDTTHNLHIFDLCREFAREEDDKFTLEIYRPYTIAFDARSRALEQKLEGKHKQALACINRGIIGIRSLPPPDEPYPEDYESIMDENQKESLESLRKVRKQILEEMPKSPIIRKPISPGERLRLDLESAINEERFEDAARLRDLIEKDKK